MRWKALAEIYKMHSFAPFSKLNFLFEKFKITKIVVFFLPNYATCCQHFARIRRFSYRFLSEFHGIL